MGEGPGCGLAGLDSAGLGWDTLAPWETALPAQRQRPQCGDSPEGGANTPGRTAGSPPTLQHQQQQRWDRGGGRDWLLGTLPHDGRGSILRPDAALLSPATNPFGK